MTTIWTEWGRYPYRDYDIVINRLSGRSMYEPVVYKGEKRINPASLGEYVGPDYALGAARRYIKARIAEADSIATNLTQ